MRTTVQERILSNKDHSPQHITLGGLRPQHIPNILFKNAQTGGGVWAWGWGAYVLCFMFYARIIYSFLFNKKNVDTYKTYCYN